MFTIDDPMLALIVRFVTDEKDVEGTDDAFLQRQVRTMQAYLSRFPEAAQESKALEWIAEYAAEYRQKWQQRVVSNRACGSRCRDCPMNLLGEEGHCQIHYRWLELLKRYTNDKITSEEYVRQGLSMLREHKRELKLCKQREREGIAQLRAFRNATNRPL